MREQQPTPSKKRTGVYVFLQIALAILLLPVLLPIALIYLVLQRTLIYSSIWLVWLPRGRDVLFVYSESPVWKEYMLEEILPLVRHRAVILNWSERSRWSRWSIAVQAFQILAGDREFNPLVMFFRPLQPAKKFRFWPALKAWKHGDKEPVTNLRQKLSLVL